MKEGYLLEHLGSFLRAQLPYYISDPLFNCLVCMGGFWGATGLYVITYNWKSIFFFPCIIGVNAIINTFIAKFYDTNI